jgi:hypothetical protein
MQLASAITGGPAPLIAAFLVAQYGSGYSVGIYISACAVLSLIGASLLTDHTHGDIAGDVDISRDGDLESGELHISPRAKEKL